MANSSVDSKREEFRIYLERSGFVSSISKALVGLYEEPEKPSNPIEYLSQRMTFDDPFSAEKVDLQAEVKELQAKVRQLEEENEELKRIISQSGTTHSGQVSAFANAPLES